MNNDSVIWETVKEAACILVRDPVTKRIIAEVPGTNSQAEAEARQIAACGFLLQTMRGLIAWAGDYEISSEAGAETPLQKARLAVMVATGRAE